MLEDRSATRVTGVRWTMVLSVGVGVYDYLSDQVCSVSGISPVIRPDPKGNFTCACGSGGTMVDPLSILTLVYQKDS